MREAGRAESARVLEGRNGKSSLNKELSQVPPGECVVPYILFLAVASL